MNRFISLRAGLVAAAGAALGVASGLPALAQQSPVVMAESVAPFGEGVQVLGDAAPQTAVHLQVALRLRDYAGLMQSNVAGKVLSPAALQARHLPTRADYDRVLNWLTTSGLTIDKTSSSRLTIQVSGDVAVMSRTFGVRFSHIRAEGRDYAAADAAPSLPSAVAPAILSINGLQPQLRAHKHSIAAPILHTDSATSPPFYAQAFLSGYGATGLGAGGKGTTTAIIIDTFPLVSDLKSYWSITGTRQKIKRFTFIQTVPGDLPPLSGEESLDAQVSSSVAPNSKVRVYASKDLFVNNIDTAYQALVDDMQGGVKVTQVSVSLGICETALPKGEIKTEDNFFATLTAMGASVFLSTGDDGSKSCGNKKPDTPQFGSTSPNVTAVGGTTLSLNVDGSEHTETTWVGGGGGVSRVFKVPSYQVGLGFNKRAVPDIAADANPGTGALVIVNGAHEQIGGTSLSTPLMAGLMALVNAERIKHHKPTLGLLNSRIYGLAPSNFRDITMGNNGGFNAGPGYDLVTGLGAPLMDHLLPALAAQP